MQYQVSRNGQLYGPYTLEDLRRYLASGNVLPDDLAKSEAMADWLPVSQILGTQPIADPAPAAAFTPPPAYPPTYPTPAYATPGTLYPDPPDLNWGLVLLFTILTCGLFDIVWSLIQAAWFQKIKPTSKVLMYYIITAVLSLANIGRSAIFFNVAFHNGHPERHFGSSLIGIAAFAISLVARFTFRADLEEHYNGPEPIGLRLSGIMTFFFGNIYFQYHFNRINQIKQSLRYRGTAI
jgi:hypothetical protein